MSLSKIMSVDCLMEAMDSVKDICSIIHSIRTNSKIRARQPLSHFKLIDPDGKFSWLPFCKDFQDVIKDECNVKEIHYHHKEGIFVL